MDIVLDILLLSLSGGDRDQLRSNYINWETVLLLYYPYITCRLLMYMNWILLVSANVPYTHSQWRATSHVFSSFLDFDRGSDLAGSAIDTLKKLGRPIQQLACNTVRCLCSQHRTWSQRTAYVLIDLSQASEALSFDPFRLL